MTTRRPRERIAVFVAPVLLALLACITVFVHVGQSTQLSPIDEWVYVDYLAKVPTEGVVTQGEETGDEARAAIACRGARFVLAPQPPLCAAVADGTDKDTSFPQGGLTSADIYTPIYFGVTWVLAQGFRLVGVDDLVDAGSAAGAIWLAAGMVFFAMALRRFGVRSHTTVGLGALLIATPTIYWANTYVSTDAPAILVGSSLLWLAARIMQGSSGRIAFVAVSVLAVLIKVQNILAVGIVALALLAWALSRAWAARDSGDRFRWLRPGLLNTVVLSAVLASVLSVVAQGTWLVMRAAIATGPSPDQGVGTALTATQLARESFKFLQSAGSDPTGRLPGPGWFVTGSLSGLVCVAGVVAAALASRRSSPQAWLSRSALLLSLVGGPALALGTTLVTGYYFMLPSRYNLPMLPFFFAAAAFVFDRTRWAGWLLVVAGGVCWAGTLLYS